MIKFLVKKCIKNSDNVSDPVVRSKYGVLSGIVGIIINIILFCGKLFAGILSGAISIIADAFNNLADAGSSIVTLIGFKLSNSHADITHPFGHGRIEYVSGLLVSIAVIIVGVELGKSSIEKLITPTDVSYSLISLVILFVAILFKIWMFAYNKYLAKKIDSAALYAVATDSISDVIATFVVLLGSIISYFFKINVDAYLGIAVSIFIIYSGISSAKDTISPLLGEAPSKELVDKISHIVLSHSQIIGIHDLIVHNYGVGRCMVTLHAEVDSEGNLIEVHDVIDDIERDLHRELNVEATIHMDPIDTNDEQTTKMKKIVIAIVKNIDDRITIHDFRMTKAHIHLNMIFDMVLPNDLKYSDEEVLSMVKEKVALENKKYFCVINIDRSFV